MFALLITEGIEDGGVIPAGYCKTGISPSGPCIYVGEFPYQGSCGAGLDPIGGSCNSGGAIPF